MKEHGAHRKPTIPFGYAHLGGGKTRYVIDRLPLNKREHERRILDEFVNALEAFDGRKLEQPVPGDIRPDFEATVDGHKVGIELVELVTEEHARARHVEEQHALKVRSELADVLPRLAGLEVILNHLYEYPTKDFTPLSEDVVDLWAYHAVEDVRSDTEKLRRLDQDDWLRPYSWGCVLRRFSIDDGQPATVGFSPYFPIATREARSLLKLRVEEKVELGYGEYGGTLWLLAYEVGSMYALGDDERGIVEARDWLDGATHPFHEVWYLWPFPGQEKQVLRRVFHRPPLPGSSP